MGCRMGRQQIQKEDKAFPGSHESWALSHWLVRTSPVQTKRKGIAWKEMVIFTVGRCVVVLPWVLINA